MENSPVMDKIRDRSLGRPVLYALVFLGLYLSYLILKPFVVALAWAILFAILFRRVQVWLTEKVGRNRAAIVTTAIVGLLIVTPAVVLLATLVREAPQVVDRLKHLPENTPPEIIRIWDAARDRSPVPLPKDPIAFVAQGAQRALSFLMAHAGAFVADFFALLGTLGAMLFALFFMLRDGDAMSRQLCDQLPFSDEESERLMVELRDLVTASAGASLAVAAAQALIGGAAFWLVGIEAPVFWGGVIAFCSLVPVVGSALVWVPAAIGLLLFGEIGRAVLLLFIGTFGISMVDNVIRPIMLTGKTSASGLVVFFGLLGGAAAFGFIGLVIGPIILVVTNRILNDLHYPDLLAESVRRKGV